MSIRITYSTPAVESYARKVGAEDVLADALRALSHLLSADIEATLTSSVLQVERADTGAVVMQSQPGDTIEQMVRGVDMRVDLRWRRAHGIKVGGGPRYVAPI
jgi:hypothetical protein